MSERSDILTVASDLISGDRAETYGDPVDNFETVGVIWGAILDANPNPGPLRPSTVALMLAGLKLARLSTNLDHRDSWVDLAGYAALGGEVAYRTDTEPRPGQFVNVPPSPPAEPRIKRKKGDYR